jgi:hypothetical protein
MPLLSEAKDVIGELIAIQGLKTKCFDVWKPELHEALQSLSETDILPHELFSLLMMSGTEKKQLVLVTDRGQPVALAGLKDRRGGWEPVTQWIVPGVLFPVKEKYIAKVLAVLGLNVRVGWWRWEIPPPPASWIRNVVSTTTYGFDCSDDHEQYWRKSGFFKSVRLFRNRCRGFTFRVNSPGSREWTIRNWEVKWRQQGIAETPGLTERLLASEYLEKKGLHHTVTLLDRDIISAGMTFLIHRNAAVAQVNYRDPRYDKYGAMSHLWDLSFNWAKEMGFAKIDIGGSFDYKEKLAPENGKKWEFDVSPRRVRLKEWAFLRC